MALDPSVANTLLGPYGAAGANAYPTSGLLAAPSVQPSGTVPSLATDSSLLQQEPSAALLNQGSVPQSAGLSNGLVPLQAFGGSPYGSLFSNQAPAESPLYLNTLQAALGAGSGGGSASGSSSSSGSGAGSSFQSPFADALSAAENSDNDDDDDDDGG